MNVQLGIQRFNPENDAKPYWQSFLITQVDPAERVLDLLKYVKAHVDGTLTFRHSCAHGVCGSDAMRINNLNRLACKTLVQALARPNTERVPIRVQPLLGLPVVKDLVVDMDPFYEHYRSIIPFLVNEQEAPGRERLQSPEERAIIDDGTKCILCACCTTSCPSFWANGRYVGPAAIVQAHRFIFDSRDTGAAERLAVLDRKTGVWRCRTVFNCTEACPRDIDVTRLIGEVKLAIAQGPRRAGRVR
jgi:succinate dehydrogenase / fumarate reductase iron-sulfur subunit